MKGKWLPLSVPRRLMTDMMRYALKVPTVPIERTMDLSAVVHARAACAIRPPWVGIFAKAFALTAREFPELRRVYLKWPWPHLYEYPSSTASILVERSYQGEPCVLSCIIREPDATSITNIAGSIHTAVEAPIEQVKAHRRALSFWRLPGIIRRPALWVALNVPRQRVKYFGTFIVTAVSLMGADALHPPTYVTTLLTFGVISPRGEVPVRVSMDHRVYDGVAVAKILAKLEENLNGPIVDELRSLAAIKLATLSR
jgi:hypothetical protein